MTPADRDAAVALAQRIADEGVQYSDVAEGANVWTEQTATDVWPADIKRIAQALVLALAERPTCATCRHYGPHEGTGFCQRIHLWKRPDFYCADHEPTPRVTCSICRRDEQARAAALEAARRTDQHARRQRVARQARDARGRWVRRP